MEHEPQANVSPDDIHILLDCSCSGIWASLSIFWVSKGTFCLVLLFLCILLVYCFFEFEQNKASFLWRHPCICTLIDHGQWPITMCIAFTSLYKRVSFMIGMTQVKAHWNTYKRMERFPFEISKRMFVSHQFS